jgi:alkylation response protein AidB-like acyl-CoA dehydrogenase
MPTRTVAPPSTGGLSAPLTSEGRGLMNLLTGELPGIRADAGPRDRQGRFPDEVFRAFRENGVMGATVPRALGGLGVSRMRDVAVALRALAEADASTALALHVQLSRGLTLAYEWQHGAPQVRERAERLLRLMATGEAAVCGAVKDAPSHVTELAPDGAGGWHLSGRKTLVTMAPIGTHFVVHAQQRLPGRPTALAAPIVERGAPGVSVINEWNGLGMRASGTLDVVFDRCPVPDDAVRSRSSVEVRDDSVLAGQTVSSVTMLGIYVGIAVCARDITMTWCRARSQQPPAAVRTLVTEIDARLYALRATADAALAEVDSLADELDLDPAERGRRMMTPFQYAKLTVNELSLRIVNDCLTAVGGAAYAESHPLARLYRDVRAGWFMQPYTYVDGVDYLSSQILGNDRDNDYVSLRANRP